MKFRDVRRYKNLGGERGQSSNLRPFNPVPPGSLSRFIYQADKKYPCLLGKEKILFTFLPKSGGDNPFFPLTPGPPCPPNLSGSPTPQVRWPCMKCAYRLSSSEVTERHRISRIWRWKTRFVSRSWVQGRRKLFLKGGSWSPKWLLKDQGLGTMSGIFIGMYLFFIPLYPQVGYFYTIPFVS